MTYISDLNVHLKPLFQMINPVVYIQRISLWIIVFHSFWYLLPSYSHCHRTSYVLGLKIKKRFLISMSLVCQRKNIQKPWRRQVAKTLCMLCIVLVVLVSCILIDLSSNVAIYLSCFAVIMPFL